MRNNSVSLNMFGQRLTTYLFGADVACRRFWRHLQMSYLLTYLSAYRLIRSGQPVSLVCKTRTEDTAEQSKVRWTGTATAVVLVDHATLESLGQRHGQQDRLVELATSRFQRHDWTDRHAVTADVPRHELRRRRQNLLTTHTRHNQPCCWPRQTPSAISGRQDMHHPTYIITPLITSCCRSAAVEQTTV